MKHHLRYVVVGFVLAAVGLPTSTVAQELRNTEIYERVRRSVFQVITPRGEGSGFLVDERGLVLTNAHVLAGFDDPSVKLGSDLKVRGQLVIQDTRADVAVLRVHPDAVRGLPTLPPDVAGFRDLAVGQDVVTVGFPLQQGAVFTAGIVSSLATQTLVSDVNLNPGNSGGPMLDRAGRVVAISTFGAAIGVGPGLGGAVGAALADSVLELAEAELEGLPLPSADRLPVMPVDAYPIRALDQARDAAEWPVDLYNLSDDTTLPDFDVMVFTPPLIRRLEARDATTAERSTGERIVLLEDLRQWALELGQYPPVVIIRAQPRVGQSALGFFANVALGVVSRFTFMPAAQIEDLEVRGDLRSFRLQVGDAFAQPIREYSPLVFAGDRVGQAGYIVVDPEVFRPGPDGFPTVVLVVQEEDSPGVVQPLVFPEATLQQIWDDFEPYRAPGPP